MNDIKKWAQEVLAQALESGCKCGYTIPQMRRALMDEISCMSNGNQNPKSVDSGYGQEEITAYVNKAYKTLVNSGAKLPKKEVMEVALRIMYVIHKQEKPDFEEFLERCEDVCCNKSHNAVRAKVVGRHLEKLYSGIKNIVMIYRNEWWNPPLVGIGTRNEPVNIWKNVNDMVRYEYLRKIERKLAADMEKI